MKRFILSVICVMVATAAIAQNERVIKGSVYNENREPIAGATIQARGNSFETKSDGSFMITVPSNTIEITASAEGYLPLTLEIDGSYMVFDLEVDKKYRVAKEKELQEAEKRAAEEAAAAEKAAAAKAKRELKAQIAEECKTHTSGFASVADFSFAIGNEMYAGVEYIAGYRINNHYFVGLGVGANLGLGTENSALLVGKCGTLTRGDYYFPAFAHFRANIINGRFSPYAALSAGANIGMPQTLHLDLISVQYKTLGAFINPQVGVSYRLTPKFGIFAAVGLNCFTAPECIESTGYSATIRQSFNYNININLGVTF